MASIEEIITTCCGSEEMQAYNEMVLTKYRTMWDYYVQWLNRRIDSLDMIQHEDLYWCLFRLLMDRLSKEYGDVPPDDASRQFAVELSKMDQTRRSYEVAVLFELVLWLRENHYHWYCNPKMKNSILLYLLGIAKTKPDLQRPSIWTGEAPIFEVTVQAEAFDKLEELFETHWFTVVCNQYYEIDRKRNNTATYGHIIFVKEDLEQR